MMYKVLRQDKQGKTRIQIGYNTYQSRARAHRTF